MGPRSSSNPAPWGSSVLAAAGREIQDEESVTIEEYSLEEALAGRRLITRARQDGMDGVYLPWTYDTKTDTQYDGQKETHYYETERRHGKTVHVRKTSWESVSATTWISSFRYKNKVYRFTVNARTGELAGDRPYSVAKISLAVIAALGVLGSPILASVVIPKNDTVSRARACRYRRRSYRPSRRPL